MSDEAPLIFARKLGMLAPVNGAAREALKAIDGQCVVKITRANRNQRRRSLYWVVCSIVADALNDMHQMTLTDQDVHDLIRKKLGLFDSQVLPSGDVHIKLRSTSDRAMGEPERAAFTDRAFRVFSQWLGVPVETLLEEGRAAA
ncbi:hypothetical protein [Rhizorhabdus wittichii]|uniref:hypothetical protein n=1 Tax=Rhizorhabdus wittichii TaxID=160791 RepID=UPI0002E7A540|nr:hypothetical protein [Rhizorhabdus wittichii]